MSISNKIDALQKKIDYLQNKQSDFQNYILKLQKELNVLKKDMGIATTTSSTTESKTNSEIDKHLKTVTKAVSKEKTTVSTIQKKHIKKNTIIDKIKKEIGFDWDVKADFENFIGTNLINKIGILILIFGVVVGAKYAIDKDLISPLTRIVIGYAISFGLLAFSVKLKEKYKNFSAVLLSGSLAMLYFLSFIAYDFYGFISQPIAFALMLLFTAFAVLASINYNKQIIALIGLVGSYAIPFMLSNNSGNVLFLLSYMSMVNIGILVLSFKKNWKLLYYTAFVFSWLIYIAWYLNDYMSKEHFYLALIFATIFFVIFYTAFLAYKLVKKEGFVKSDIIFIMLNSFIYYGIGYSILNGSKIGENYLGLFTVFNAIVHFAVSKLIFKQKEDGDKKLFYLASVMVLVFITMAIPVQLDGSWITLFWAIEAALLFWIGRTKGIAIYEKISYGLMFLAFFSLIQDWQISYAFVDFKAFFNVTFLTALITSICFAFITKVFYDDKYSSQITKLEEKNTGLKAVNSFYSLMKYIAPVMFIVVLFGTFAKEIAEYFNILYRASAIEIKEENYNYFTYNYDLQSFGAFWMLIYTIVFATLASFINIKYLKIKKLANISLVFSVLVLFISLSGGLMICSELRESLLRVSENQYYTTNDVLYSVTRYVLYAFIALLVFSIYKQIKAFFDTKKMKQFFWLGLHVVILWILSSELLNWMDINNHKNAYKISLTILWASYSLMAVALGIWKNHKYLRLGAIGLFGITLVKLFLYDLAGLSTIQKTIVLISVGVLLLIVSFLYNKYTKRINDGNNLPTDTENKVENTSDD